MPGSPWQHTLVPTPQLVKRSILLVGLALFVITTADAKKVTSKHGSMDLPDSVVKYEWPKTPYLARLHGLDGYGVYRLNIDRATGTVSSVTIVKTTTHKMLDDAAVDAFRKWRFQPNSISELTLPGTFTVIGSGKRHPLSEARRLAIYAPTPERPRSGRSGSGVYRFIIDYNTGRTTDVQIIRSSGHEGFDAAVVRAYRQWRFVPRSARSIDTTVGFAP